MNSGKVTENPLHDEVLELLPWYVNGTLSDSQKARVEDHVSSCIACRRELAIERRTMAAFRDDSPVDRSAQAGFERLHARITGTAPPTRASTARWRGLNRRWRQKVGRYLPVPGFQTALIALPVAALLVSFGLFSLLAGIPGSDVEDGAASIAGHGGDYHTLASSRGAAPHRDDIHVVLARNRGVGNIVALLESLNAQVIAGPNEAGVYTIRLSDVTDKGGRQKAITELRRHPSVLFAEAAQPMAVPQPGSG